MKKLFSVLAIIVFLGAVFAPMAQSMSVHFCKHSEGPCKHGDACPMKHKSQKKGEKGHHKKPNCYIECSTPGGTAKHFMALEMPFITTALTFSFHETQETHLVKAKNLLKDFFPDPFDRPPATF